MRELSSGQPFIEYTLTNLVTGNKVQGTNKLICIMVGKLFKHYENKLVQVDANDIIDIADERTILFGRYSISYRESTTINEKFNQLIS